MIPYVQLDSHFLERKPSSLAWQWSEIYEAVSKHDEFEEQWVNDELAESYMEHFYLFVCHRKKREEMDEANSSLAKKVNHVVAQIPKQSLERITKRAQNQFHTRSIMLLGDCYMHNLKGMFFELFFLFFSKHIPNNLALFCDAEPKSQCLKRPRNISC
jgi:hypothetical protein